VHAQFDCGIEQEEEVVEQLVASLEHYVGDAIRSWCFVWAKFVNGGHELFLHDLCPFFYWFRVMVVVRDRQQSWGGGAERGHLPGPHFSFHWWLQVSCSHLQTSS